MEKWVSCSRCRKCGKFSFAKRKPRKHQRWVIEGEPEFDELKDETAGSTSYDHINGFVEVSRGHFVDCGPFDYWTATYQGYDQRDGNPDD